jgi:KDO2-lipid IV(A) lauroyltransferase
MRLCYPDLTAEEHISLTKRCFESVAMGMIEVAMAWWMPNRRIQNLAHWHGTEHLDKALAEGRNIILAGAHFTCLEIGGRLFADKYPYHLLYRPHKNALFNDYMTEKRERHAASIIKRDDMRGMIRQLKSGTPVWYAPDQDYGAKYSVFAPFFGIQAASVTIMSRLAKQVDAVVIPIVYHRLPAGQGYEFKFMPPLENYPSDDIIADCTQFNSILEQDLRDHPDQYLWQHRSFKTRPDCEAKPYQPKKSCSFFNLKG